MGSLGGMWWWGGHVVHPRDMTWHGIPTDPPYISNAKNTGASVGQKGILQCEASAVPVAEFQWFKEDTRCGCMEDAGRDGGSQGISLEGGQGLPVTEDPRPHGDLSLHG